MTWCFRGRRRAAARGGDAGEEERSGKSEKPHASHQTSGTRHVFEGSRECLSGAVVSALDVRDVRMDAVRRVISDSKDAATYFGFRRTRQNITPSAR
jgi:hypothetical protein